MFKATLKECIIFKRIVDATKELINEVNIEVNADGKGVKDW